jgi:hypothetical protein
MRAIKQKSGLAWKNAELKKNAIDGQKSILKTRWPESRR